MIKKFFISLIFTSFLALPAGVSAQSSVDVLDDICRKKPDASACVDRVKNPTDNRQNPIYGPNGIITKVVNLVTIIVGIVAVISIIFAGFRLITSGNNPQEVTKARELIIYAIVGLLVAAFAQILVRYVLDNVL